jgi:hypothetical protein
MQVLAAGLGQLRIQKRDEVDENVDLPVECVEDIRRLLYCCQYLSKKCQRSDMVLVVTDDPSLAEMVLLQLYFCFNFFFHLYL